MFPLRIHCSFLVTLRYTVSDQFEKKVCYRSVRVACTKVQSYYFRIFYKELPTHEKNHFLV